MDHLQITSLNQIFPWPYFAYVQKQTILLGWMDITKEIQCF